VLGPPGEVPRSLGGLAVLPGSQHSSGVAARPLRRLEPGWRTADYEPGDILVFHCLTTHAASRTDRPACGSRPSTDSNARPAGPEAHGARPPWRRDGFTALLGDALVAARPCTLALFDDGGDRTRASLPAPPSHLVTFAN